MIRHIQNFVLNTRCMQFDDQSVHTHISTFYSLLVHTHGNSFYRYEKQTVYAYDSVCFH